MSPTDSGFSVKEGVGVFSPKDNLEVARAGPALVNDAEDLVLVSMSQFTFSDKPSLWMHISTLDCPPRSVDAPLSAPCELFWLDDRTIGQVVSSHNSDCKEVNAISIRVDAEGVSVADAAYRIGSLPAGAGNFIYSQSGAALVFSAGVYDDFDLANVLGHDEAWNNRGNSALVYESTFMRCVDTWRTPKRSSLFSVTLQKTSAGWQLGNTYRAPLKGTGHHAPSDPYGGTDEFAVSSTSLVYTTKDPRLPAAWHTKQDIYIVDLKGATAPRQLTSDEQGATRSPKFNKRGDKVAWLEQAEDGDEAAKTYVAIYDLTADVRTNVLVDWDRSPDSFAFSPADDLLYLTVPDNARGKIFAVPLTLGVAVPQALTSAGTASALAPLTDGRLLFMRSSFAAPSDIFVLQPSTSVLAGERRITDFYKDALAEKYLDPATEIFWTGGAVKDRKLQGWVFVPPGFKKGDKKKWPALMLIHGGPQALWQDMWFARYNPNVYANQGYVLFAPNWTGSVSFGQSFTDAIAGDWGGAPFEDMRAGWTEFIKQHPEVDTERTAGWGASWGGYGVNWIAGHPEYGFPFKALVNICGIFNLTSFGWSTSESYFYNRAIGGMPWQKHALAQSEKMSPANYVDKWTTPMLIIHGSKDYGIAESEAIAAFHALQQRGIRSRLIMFPDDNHYIMNPANALKYTHEIFRWLDEFIGSESTAKQ